MVPRRLGNTGLSASPISLGTTKLGRNTQVKYPQQFELPSDQRVEELLAATLELGVSVIDTAPAYGDSELRLGPFVAAHRERIVLCTKCGERYENGRSIYDFSPRAIDKSVDESLRRLRTDHIDILLLHSDGRDVEILTQTAVLDALARLKSAGKTGAVGISAKTAAGILAARATLDVVMAPFSQQDPSLAEALGKAHDAGLGVMAIKVLASGYLEPAKAIDFALRQPFIDSLVVGTIDPAHLREAVTIANSVR